MLIKDYPKEDLINLVYEYKLKDLKASEKLNVLEDRLIELEEDLYLAEKQNVLQEEYIKNLEKQVSDSICFKSKGGISKILNPLAKLPKLV